MRDKEFLLNGDLKMIASKLNLSDNHVRMVARGERKSARVEFALSELAQLRKDEVKNVIEELKIQR